MDALDSVLKQETDFQYEVLVMDNACDDDLKVKIEEVAGQTEITVRYIPVHDIGLHNGRNMAAIKASGEIVVYIDDDIIAPPYWLSAIYKPFEDKAISGVGGKVLALWESAAPEWVSLIDPSYYSLLDMGVEQRSMFPKYPYGCNMAYRRNIILEMNGFPPDGLGGGAIEWYRGDGETGFARKVYASNHMIVYTGRATLYHRIPASRMTLGYVRNRTMKIAISGFYTQMREHQYKKMKLFQESVKNILRFVKYKTVSIFSKHNCGLDRWLPVEIKAFLSIYLALYQMRLVFDSDLRKWVTQPTYLQVDGK